MVDFLKIMDVKANFHNISNGRLMLSGALVIFGIVGLFLFAEESILGVLSFTIYIMIVLWLVLSYHERGADPLKIFCALSFVGFGMGYLIFHNNPSLFYFFNESAYSPAFLYRPEDLSTTFFVFLVGFLAYLIGSWMVLPAPLLAKSNLGGNTYLMTLLALLIVIFSYWFRAEFRVGLPGVDTVSFPFVGYVYFPLLALASYSLGYSFLCALRSGSVLAIAASLVVVLIHSGSVAILGWKSAIFQDILLLGLIFINYSILVGPVTLKIRRFLIWAILIMCALAYASFGAIGYYREQVVLSGGTIGLSEFISNLPQYFTAFDQLSEGRNDSGISGLFGRVSGINYLTPVVSYFSQNDAATDVPSFFLNMLRISDYYPENFLTNTIVGVPESVVSMNAPGGWGAFYIYGGIPGVFVGMLVFGAAFQNSYRFVKNNATRDQMWLVVYAMVIVDIYLSVIFEGVILNHLFKHIPALIFSYFVFKGIVNLANRIGAQR